ncbi:MAG: aminotransferase class V-fold PLP-dependent enzyme, partial [Anaerolineae bacterium]|nr:aminotransferase class V-fold PLP-dependent enzyme [Anaerolineae bacterium]
MRDLFLLDPDVVFLNHGSFGACPRAVFETYQYWQMELERQPVRFFGRSEQLLHEAREHLGRYLNTAGDNLVYVTNVTMGMNIVARSLRLQTGDEILTTDHEYGAVNKTWDFVCHHTGAHLVKHKMPIPMTTAEDFVEEFWSGVTPQTKVISISHITSPTALIFPIAEICRRARAAGILTAIDGAHAVGQIPVDLEAIGADFYTGNCHKWLCAPKGSGFLYTRPEHQDLLDPIIISHGWGKESTYISRHQYQGTRDLAAFLAVPAAIEFQRAHDWEAVRRRCHRIAADLRGRLCDLTGLEPFSPDSTDWFMQMVAVPLPPCDDPG